MDLADVRPGQRVRWTLDGVTRTGQVFLVARARGLVHVLYFSGVHRDWVQREFRPEQLEPFEESTIT